LKWKKTSRTKIPEEKAQSTLSLFLEKSLFPFVAIAAAVLR